jgi:hypothetical protein
LSIDSTDFGLSIMLNERSLFVVLFILRSSSSSSSSVLSSSLSLKWCGVDERLALGDGGSDTGLS